MRTRTGRKSAKQAPRRGPHPHPITPQPQLHTPGREILVVDDDVAIRQALAGLLLDEGYRVTCAEHGMAALEHLRAAIRRPALILLDLMMPVLDGRAFRMAQLQDPSLNHIPVILLSACGRGEMAEVNADAFVEKPPRVDVLLPLVERLSAER